MVDPFYERLHFTPRGGYITGLVGRQWLGGATPETREAERRRRALLGLGRVGAEAGAGVVVGDFAPEAELLQRAALRAIRQRIGLGEEQKAAALMAGIGRGMARAGETAGALAMIERETGRDVFELQRNLQLQLAQLAEARARAEARATGFGEGVLVGGPRARALRGRQPGVYAAGVAMWDRPEQPHVARPAARPAGRRRVAGPAIVPPAWPRPPKIGLIGAFR